MRLFCFGLGYSARRLIARAPGLEASGLTRDAETARALRRQGVEAFVLDPAGAESAMLRAFARAQVLLVSAPPGPQGDPALARFAPEIADAHALERIVYLSSVGVYGDHGGGWVDESAQPLPTSARARLRLASEDQWRALGRVRRLPVDVLRLAGIYGPGRNVLVKLRAGSARRIVKPGHVVNRIHVEDIAEIARRLIERGGEGGTWNIADEEPAPPQDVVAYAARRLGIAPPAEEAFATASLSAITRSFYVDNRRVAVEKLRRAIAYRWIYANYRDGLDALAGAGEGREAPADA